jgi:hypothetical protein
MSGQPHAKIQKTSRIDDIIFVFHILFKKMKIKLALANFSAMLSSWRRSPDCVVLFRNHRSHRRSLPLFYADDDCLLLNGVIFIFGFRFFRAPSL